MTSYVFRVRVLPNPPLEFEPDTEVWRDIEVDGSHTLADVHEAIFDAFERWDTHGYEFIARDDEGIALRSYPHPQLYDGGPSWPPMDDEEIDRFIDQAVPDDVSEDAKQRFRDLQSNPPAEGSVTGTTIGDLDSEGVETLSYTFDMGDNWEHYIELQDTREESLDGNPAVVNEQGAAPPQYPEVDD
ncbi:IS1096 element passenger TnpR family protein [Halobacterium salinarum]|uniref:IS1096 element passenger TnpR family protein n=1 Tax=Halobacterium salinarum TaxID=2242 RepID=UPI0025538DAB|nr:hypothetical protein [Halobacterium salinarum]MDL0126652.1 hypothetical protein [Halobacterium salinarum]